MSDDPRRWTADRSAATFEELAPGVLLFKFSGHMAASLVANIEGAVAPYVERGQEFDIFFDTQKMTGYHPDFRQKMTAWHEAVRPSTRYAGVFIASKVVSMAISIANLVTGGMLKTFSDRFSFEARIAESVRAAGGAPRSVVPPRAERP